MVDNLDSLACGRPLEIGVPAPDFTLTMVRAAGPVSLADYRGKAPLLLGLYRGLYCAFCRRAVARLGRTGDRLRPLGIETLAVIGTTVNNARLYYRHHETRMAIAADPALVTHRAYGLPKVETTWEVVSAKRVNPTGDTDKDDGRRTWNQSVGEFLIDRDGIVRWLYVEGTTAADYMAKFSSEEGLLSAVNALPPSSNE
jgi:peroxiredoxin